MNSVKELIEVAKTGTLSYGSPGLGNPIHFTTAAINLRAGTTMTHVPYKGFTLDGGWQAWMAPAGTPPAILAKLHGAMVKAIKSDELRAFIRSGGYVPDGRGPQEFRVQMMSDLKRFNLKTAVAPSVGRASARLVGLKPDLRDSPNR